MGTRSYIFLGILILLGVIWFGVYLVQPPMEDTENITTFEECVAAGNPVLESYPRQCRDREGNMFVENIGNELEKSDFIRISTPRPNDTVTSPLTIEGEARGTWYFEASFPVEIRDANDKLVAQHFATAKGDWMTEDFVSFSTTISFPTPETKTGTLILRKDNPSGLPQHDDELIVPIRFDLSEERMISTIHVLHTSDIENGANCTNTVPIERTTVKTVAVARTALEELLGGLTEEEKTRGYTSAIPENVELTELRIEGGVALADFSNTLDASGSCTVSAIRAQIENTLKEFPIVEDVIISINGETEEILQP